MNKSDVTYQDKVNELRLDLSHPKNKQQAFVLVEGNSDIRLYRKLFDLSKCNVECVPGGNVKLEKCVSDLCKMHKLLIGIRDSDFLKVSANPYSVSNMFTTDLHDIEMMLISEDEVFQSLCHECTTTHRQINFQTRNDIFSLISEISLLKWLNYEKNLEFSFNTGFTDLFILSQATFDFSLYLSRVLAKSPQAKIKDESEIRKQIDNLRTNNANPYHITNGHDFVKTLSTLIGGGRGTIYTSEVVSAALRMSYTVNHFRKTNLYDALLQWSITVNHHILN